MKELLCAGYFINLYYFLKTKAKDISFFRIILLFAVPFVAVIFMYKEGKRG